MDTRACKLTATFIFDFVFYIALAVVYCNSLLDR